MDIINKHVKYKAYNVKCLGMVLDNKLSGKLHKAQVKQQIP